MEIGKKQIEIFSMVSPQTNSYLPLLNPGFKTRLLTDFTPQVTSWVEEVSFFIANPTFNEDIRCSQLFLVTLV